MNLFKDLAPAIKKETKRVGIFTFSGVVIMWIVFLILHACMPEKVPFDYTVILGGSLGGLIAVLNFFLMGVTVQKVASEANEDNARLRHCSSLFSVCCRNSSPVVPEFRDQAHGIDS